MPPSYQQGAILKPISAALFAVLSAGLLAGCSSQIIGKRIGAEEVRLVASDQTATCKIKGRVTVSVLAEVAFVPRSSETVEANLIQMAKNEAVAVDGDSVVKGSSPVLGKRTFEIFRCRP